MIPGDCFQSMIPIFRHQLAHIGCMEARCLRNLTEFHTLCSQFKCFQSCIRTFVLCLSACCLYCGHFLIAEFIVRCHYSSPRYSIAFLVRRLKCFTRFWYQNVLLRQPHFSCTCSCAGSSAISRVRQHHARQRILWRLFPKQVFFQRLQQLQRTELDRVRAVCAGHEADLGV